MNRAVRVPLSLLAGTLDRVASAAGQLSPEVLDLILSSRRNVWRLVRQINAAFDFCRSDSGQIQMRHEWVSLSNLWDDCIRLFDSAIRNKKLTLIVEERLDPMPEIAADREKIDLIMANLLDNAIQFSPMGGEIRVGFSANDTEHSFWIRDHGPGMPPEWHSLVFERFASLPNIDGRGGFSTGIGLAMVREAAQAHGGSVRLESELGRGTSVFLTLPVRKNLLQTSPRSDSASNGFKGGDSSRPNHEYWLHDWNHETQAKRLSEPTKGTILHLDPDLETQIQFSNSFGNQFHIFFWDSAFGDLMDFILKLKPDLIVSEMAGVGVDRLELCKKVRQEPLLRCCGFLFLVATYRDPARMQAWEAGADDLISKPCSETELLVRMRNIVQQRQAQKHIVKQLGEAACVQHSLLPLQTDFFDCLRMEYLYRPLEELSGDLLDCMVVGSWVYLIVADVTGHGIAAAQVTYMVRDLFRQYCLDPSQSLVESFSKMAERYSKYTIEFDAAVQLARFDSVTKRFEYVRANAPAAIHCKAGGTTQIDVRSLPDFSRRWKRSSQFAQENLHSQVLASGEQIFIFTDGVHGAGTGGRRTASWSTLKVMEEAVAAGVNWRKMILKSQQHLDDDLTIVKWSFV
jgi:serine phosphatase RsbU (regulator of sigma subunit)